MFVKSLQLNMSLTTFDAEVGTLFHCFNNNSKKIYSSQLLKLQQSSLTQINNSHWWYCKYSRFLVGTHKKNHMERSGDRGSYSFPCCIVTTQLLKRSGNLSLTARSLWAGAPSCIHYKRWKLPFSNLLLKKFCICGKTKRFMLNHNKFNHNNF